MSFAADREKEEIRNRVPLEDVVREYNVVLRSSGRRLKGLCPFHAEKTPSFSVDAERQYYYCFGCQEKGDVFTFIQKMEHLDFAAALELLARRAGVTLTGRRSGSGTRVLALYDALGLAQDFYHRFLLRDPAAAPARDYLRRRGIEERMWERFRLGYSPRDGESFLNFARAKGVPVEALEGAGLARRASDSQPEAGPAGGRLRDLFRGRVMFPISDGRNRVAGFGARTLGDDVPKYLNTPRTAVFDKSQVLYGLPEARRGIQKEGVIAIVEGYTDAIVAHQAGLDFVVASLGTAFTAENARKLGRMTPKVLLIFDGDAAGQKASERSLDLLVGESLDVRVYSVKDGKDPCDAILSLGGDEFRRRLEAESVGLFEFKWKRTMEGQGVATAGPAVRARALDEFLGLLSRVPNVVAQKLYLREFAEKMGISEKDMETRLRQKSAGGRRFAPGRRFEAEQGSEAAQGSPAGRYAPGNPEPRDAMGGPEAEGESAAGSAAERRGGDRETSDSRGSDRKAIEAVLVECMLALPDRAPEILAEAPPESYSEPVLAAVARLVARRLEAGSLSPEGLLREASEAGVAEAVMDALSRLEDDEGSPSCDYEEVWRLARRDLKRRQEWRQAERLQDLMAGARREGDAEKLALYQREYFEVLRQAKRGNRTRSEEP